MTKSTIRKKKAMVRNQMSNKKRCMTRGGPMRSSPVLKRSQRDKMERRTDLPMERGVKPQLKEAGNDS